jgi:hypothetical protein
MQLGLAHHAATYVARASRTVSEDPSQEALRGFLLIVPTGRIVTDILMPVPPDARDVPAYSEVL